MDQRFEHLITTRKHFVSLIENFSTEQLNKIPEGFSNNIIWNIVHCMVTQQGLIYGLAFEGNFFFGTYKQRNNPKYSTGEYHAIPGQTEWTYMFWCYFFCRREVDRIK